MKHFFYKALVLLLVVVFGVSLSGCMKRGFSKSYSNLVEKYQGKVVGIPVFKVHEVVHIPGDKGLVLPKKKFLKGPGASDMELQAINKESQEFLQALRQTGMDYKLISLQKEAATDTSGWIPLQGTSSTYVLNSQNAQLLMEEHGLDAVAAVKLKYFYADKYGRLNVFAAINRLSRLPRPGFTYNLLGVQVDVAFYEKGKKKAKKLSFYTAKKAKPFEIQDFTLHFSGFKTDMFLKVTDTLSDYVDGLESRKS
jgi:hypothetical protein